MKTNKNEKKVAAWDKIPGPALPTTRKKTNINDKTKKQSTTTTTENNKIQAVLSNNNERSEFATPEEWYLPNKDINSFRVCSQNIDGIPISKFSAKSVNCIHTMSESESDAWLIQETKVQWESLEEDEQWNERWRSLSGRKHKYYFAHNRNESKKVKSLPGGVGIICAGRSIGRCYEHGKDHRNLGRWVWVKMNGRGDTKLVLVSAYRPVSSSGDGPSTVIEQQRRVLSEKGIDEDPRTLLLSELSKAIQEWQFREHLFGKGNLSCSGTCNEIGLLFAY